MAESMMGIHVRQEKFLNPPYILQTGVVAHNNILHRIPCDTLLVLKPHYFQHVSSHGWHAFTQWITNINLYLTYSPCFMNSQIKTKEHYVIWYLMIMEILHINLLPPWNFLCSPCTPSCMHINPLTPNVNYSGHTAPLTSKVAFYIFIQQI